MGFIDWFLNKIAEYRINASQKKLFNEDPDVWLIL